MNASEYESIKRQIENLRTQFDRQEGRIAESMKTLKKEFGVKDLPAAKKLLKKKKKEQSRIAKGLAEASNSFKRKWHERLQRVSKNDQ